MINPTALIETYLTSFGGNFTDFESQRIESPSRLTERYEETNFDEIIIPSKKTEIPSPFKRGSLSKSKLIQGQVKLTAEQKDLLKEIGNIGSGNAVTALSRLIKKKIDLDLTDVGLISFDKLKDQFSSPKEKVCGIFCHIEKPSQSTILQVFDFKPLMGLVADLTGNQSKINPNKVEAISDLDDYAISTITEMGNIMAGHYAYALADLTGQKMMIDIPELAMSEASQLGEFLSKELKSISDYIIIIQTSIKIVDMKMKGLFFFIPDLKTLENMFKRLGLKFEGLSQPVKSSKVFNLKDFKLKEIQRDALQEVGNIGAGNAANALAQMINKRVTIDIPSVEMVELDKYADNISKKNVDLMVLWSNVTGKTRATVLTLFNIKDIIDLTSILVDDTSKKEIDLRKKFKSIEDLPELYLDAMKELGHILGSHYTNAIGDLLEIKLMTDPPDLSLDNGKQLFKILKEEIGLLKKLSLVITTNVIITDYKTTGTFLFIPNTETLEELIIALDNFYS